MGDMDEKREAQQQICCWLVEGAALKLWQVENTVELLNGGATIPFVARYRKEQTGELDEVVLRQLQEQLCYFNDLNDRKATVVKTIAAAGALTADLRAQIHSVREKALLEDLYLPYKPRRRTRATMARERGLEPLAVQILNQRVEWHQVQQLAQRLTTANDELDSADMALRGAGDIIAEGYSEQSDVRTLVRQRTWAVGVLKSTVAKGFDGKISKYETYYDFSEPIRHIPSHRLLAMRRGEKEDVLRLTLVAPAEELVRQLAKKLLRCSGQRYQFLLKVVSDSYQRLLAPAIEVELRLNAKNSADEAAIKVFADNLRHLLLAAPAGSLRVLGVDPGLRTGSKLAVVDETGCFFDHETIYPHTGKGSASAAKATFLSLVEKYNIQIVAVGNGTAGREMEQFCRQALQEFGGDHAKVAVVMISEAGASVYSASDCAREEFPDLDLTIRGAISIARRLQDPLAELVKVEPKSIGVGQYQHDVNQKELKTALDAVVESCVNFVGVNLNTASSALLSYVSGIGPALAKAIVLYRDDNGAFVRRKDLLKVPRLGAKAYQQAAGFLRVTHGEPLDNTAVHPEHYALVKRMASDAGCTVPELLGQTEKIEVLALDLYVDETIGLPTLRDIHAELLKPGRDPRQQFQTAEFRDDVTQIGDLHVGMILNGCVTNVAAFGAFVDVGVHQDGLVHVSQLANRFVKDAADCVHVGQLVRVKVLSVDEKRRRIGLSMKQVGETGTTVK